MKNFIKKLIFTSTLLVLLAILIAFLFVLYFKSVEENHYMKNSSVSFENSFTYFEARTNQAKTVLDEYTVSQTTNEEDTNEEDEVIDDTDDDIDEDQSDTDNLDIDEARSFSSGSASSDLPYIDDVFTLDAGVGFVGMGYINIPSAGAMAEVFFCDNGKETSLKIISDIYSGFGDEYIMFGGVTSDSEDYFFYGKKTDRIITGYDFLLVASNDSPIKGFSDYSFTDFAILNKHGVVVESLIGGIGFTSLKGQDINGDYMDIDQKEYLVFSKHSTSNFSDYYLAGIIDKATITSHIAGMTVRVYVFIFIFCIIVFAVFAFLIYLMLTDKTKTGLGEYYIEVDETGNILNVDKRFEKNYKKLTGNISDYLSGKFSDDAVVIQAEKLEPVAEIEKEVKTKEKAEIKTKEKAEIKSNDKIEGEILDAENTAEEVQDEIKTESITDIEKEAGVVAESNVEYVYFNCRKILRKTSKNVIFMASDISDVYTDYLRIHRQHFMDDLTGMPNAVQMEMDFNEFFQSRGKADVGFIIYDLGAQKYSALYGFEFYKKLIKVLVGRVNEIYANQAKVYYLTGDRLMVMSTKNINEIIAKVDSAIEYIGAAVRIDDLIINAIVKAGFLIYTISDDELALSQIISRTEVALAYAKNSNKKNNYGYVDSIMKSKQALSNDDIKEIIALGDVVVQYQPQYSLSKKKIVAFETLSKLSGKYSNISPSAFIENAEQNGTMVMLGDYIIEKAMKFAATLEDKSIRVFINISSLQLLGDKFVDRFIACLNTNGLLSSQIGIEISETYEISSMAKAKSALKELQKQGIHISIDDFGEKYSFIKYINDLPVNSIKIDKLFSGAIEKDKHSVAIIEFIMGLSKTLGLYTIVEGIETMGQVSVLKELGADIIQGHIVGSKLTEDMAIEYLTTKKNLFPQEGLKK